MSTKEFRDGDRVRLDVMRITHYKDYDRFIPAYRKFVEQSEGKIYTVRKEGRLYTFEELRKMRYSWLFWPEDLILVEKGGQA